MGKSKSIENFNYVSFSLLYCSDLKGVIVTLSDDGHLQCSYLGTDPSLFQAPKVESRELNYDELDKELKELQKLIKDVNKLQGISFEAFYYLILAFIVEFILFGGWIMFRTYQSLFSPGLIKVI